MMRGSTSLLCHPKKVYLLAVRFDSISIRRNECLAPTVGEVMTASTVTQMPRSIIQSSVVTRRWLLSRVTDYGLTWTSSPLPGGAGEARAATGPASRWRNDVTVLKAASVCSIIFIDDFCLFFNYSE